MYWRVSACWKAEQVAGWVSTFVLLLLVFGVEADPTWPSPTDDLEEIMYQLKAFKGRRFADTVSPCTNEASGPGRQNAAEWLRLGFHDMATADVATGVGGLDGSIQYMLDNGENLGPGFNTTLKFLARYLSPRASLADLIALGVYASVRSCGGPKIPVRGGRIDAIGAGNMGVPQPEHDIALFRQQFARMGFSAEEMIQVTACGHTLGGVHSNEFPELISDSEVGTDSTVAIFDNKVVTEYLDGNTTNPLVVGPAVILGKNSDHRIFNSDGNSTIKALSDSVNFQTVCQKVLQKMIDVVPAGVVLSDPILPYMVKPVELKLTLESGARSLLLKGNIRVCTTALDQTSIKDMVVSYKDRSGGAQCGSCSIRTQSYGAGRGLDDSFSFFPIEASIPVKTGISSFTITLNLKNGTSLYFDNNGHFYPVQDAVILARPQSCLLQHTGVVSITAAIRNDRDVLPTSLLIDYKVPRRGLPVPRLSSTALPMSKGPCIGLYTLYTANWTIPGGVSVESKVSIVSGDEASRDMVIDGFNTAAGLPGNCVPFRGPAECERVAVPLLMSTVAPTSIDTVFGVPTALSTMVTAPTLSTTMTPSKPGGVPTYTPKPNNPDFHPGTTSAGFFQYMTNYFVNFFFGYDRWQLVNHQLGRAT